MWENIIIRSFCLSGLSLHAQEIRFETGAWREVIKNAKYDDQPIYPDVCASWQDICMMMADSRLEAGDKAIAIREEALQKTAVYKMDGIRDLAGSLNKMKSGQL